MSEDHTVERMAPKIAALLTRELGPDANVVVADLRRVTCDGEDGTGYYQPIDPVAYEACAAGRPGWAFLE